jgi:uncharacterized protein
MSRENVEIVRRAYEAFARGDVEHILAVLDPAVEWHTRDNLPDSGVYRGPQAVLGWFATWLSAWRDFEIEAEEFIDAGDRVLVVTRQSGKGAGSGAFSEFAETHAWKLRDGKAVEVVEYRTRDEALEAVELRE